MKNESLELVKKVGLGTVLALLIVIFSGLVNEDGVNRLMAAFGYGGGGHASGPSYSPIYVTTPFGQRDVDVQAINVPLSIDSSKSGFLERTFRSGHKLDIYIPRKSAARQTTVDVSLLSEYSFAVTATGDAGMSGLDKEMSIEFYTVIPENTDGLRVYHFNEFTNSWEALSSAKYSFAGDRVTIYAPIFGRYAISYDTPRDQVQEPAQTASRSFAINSFVRDGSGRIYLIVPNGKRHIRSLAELRSFGHVSYTQVDASLLNAYPDVAVANVRYFAPGTLVKDEFGRIYQITGNGKKHIRSLSEFLHLRARNLVNVSEADIAGYANL